MVIVLDSLPLYTWIMEIKRKELVLNAVEMEVDWIEYFKYFGFHGLP